MEINLKHGKSDGCEYRPEDEIIHSIEKTSEEKLKTGGMI